MNQETIENDFTTSGQTLVAVRGEGPYMGRFVFLTNDEESTTLEKCSNAGDYRPATTNGHMTMSYEDWKRATGWSLKQGEYEVLRPRVTRRRRRKGKTAARQEVTP